MSNKGKKKFWWCACQEHCYDDFANVMLCRHLRRKDDVCGYPALAKQPECPLYERGPDAAFLTPERQRGISLDDAVRRCEETAGKLKETDRVRAGELLRIAGWLKELKRLRTGVRRRRKAF